MPNEALSVQNIDYLASVMGESIISADERRELERIYESLVVNRRGSRRTSKYTPIGERARQKDVNALSFLEFVARQLNERDHNILGKRRQNPDAKPESYAELQNSPMAAKLKSQYRDEFDKIINLPALQVDALWNEVILYAKLGLEPLRQKSAKSPALKNYQIPEITETPTLDFLLLPFATAASRHPVTLKDTDRRYLENGRKSVSETASRHYLTAGYASYLIEIASLVMEQIARANGLDLFDRIARKNMFLEKLGGSIFIDNFEFHGRGYLHKMADEGNARYVFYEISSIARNADKYRISLDSLVTMHEADLLKRKAVNHPERGLRGELLDIMHDVSSGKTWRRGHLSATDKFVPYCNDETLITAYHKIRSAIEALADSTYRSRFTGIKFSEEELVDDAKPIKPIAIPGTTSDLFQRERIQTPKDMYPKIKMDDSDARTILSMFESGNLEGIVSYDISHAKVQKSAYANANVDTGSKRASDINYRRIAFVGLTGAAAIAALFMFHDANKDQTASDPKIAVEIPCDNITRRIYNKGADGFRIGPQAVCKPDETAKAEGYGPELSKPIILEYGVIERDNLTHIAKRALGINDERTAYLTALEIARINGITNPNNIHPGQRLSIPLYLKQMHK